MIDFTIDKIKDTIRYVYGSWYEKVGYKKEGQQLKLEVTKN